MPHPINRRTDAHGRWNRRHFLTTAIQSTAGAALMGCAAPGGRVGSGNPTIIDTHSHFYDPTRPEGVPWPPPGDRLLYRRVLPEVYRSLPVPHSVTGTVVVEASPWVEDNQWLLDLAAKDSFIVGIVGNLPIGSARFPADLKRFADSRLFRGIRIRDRTLEGALEDPAFVAHLKLLADRDLSLDLVGGREILLYADRLAKELPSQRIVIDHLAGLVVDGHTPAKEWLQMMQALARRPSVYLKVSGLVEGTGRSDGTAPADVEFYRPVLDTLREMFGPERLMYASNWPVSERFASLGTVQGIVGQYFQAHGRTAAQQVFAGTAMTVYKWVQTARQVL